jgi:uncharacterized BrkB/YihY/UPF0761 family membrane protein
VLLRSKWLQSSFMARLTRVLIFPLAALLCFLGSYLVALLCIGLNNGFGSGDMPAFLYWTVPFSLAVLLLTVPIALLIRKLDRFTRLSIAIVAGAIAGFCWTLLNYGFLGPWFGAWSFPVVDCWIAGGVIGIITVALPGKSRIVTVVSL